MTAAKSENNKQNKSIINSFIKARIKTNIIASKKLLTVICILHAIGFPLIMALGVYSEFCYEKYDDYRQWPDVDMYIIAAGISGIIALLAGFVVAMYTFRYLYQKSYVDMNLSLPLTSKQRFFTDYLTGLAIYLVPALSAWLLGDMIGFIGVALHLEDMSEIMNNINICGIMVVMAMILFYTLTVFCITCCGNIVEAISSSILINGIIPLFLFVLGLCLYENTPFGLDSASLMQEQIYFTSPLGCIIFAVIIMDFENISEMPYFTSWIFSIIVYIAIIVTVTYFLYKKRKAENVSKPYIYKFLYYAITSAILFCIIAILTFEGGDFFSAIFIGAIVYFIFEVVTKRGFKKFQYTVLRYVGTVMSVMFVLAITSLTNGFGIYKYVPNPAGVSQVELNTYSYYYASQHYDLNDIFSDKNVIKTVTEIQKKYIDQYDNTSDYNFSYCNIENQTQNPALFKCDNSMCININYYMKNGNIVSREYNIIYEDFYKILSSVIMSDDYSKYAEETIKERWSHQDDGKLSKEMTIKETKSLKNFSVNLSEEELNQLIDAYKADLSAFTQEEYYSSQTIGMIYDTFDIRESFTNTIAFLEQHIPALHLKSDSFKLSELAGANVEVYKDVLLLDRIFNEDDYYDYYRIWNRYTAVNMAVEYYYYNDESNYSIGSQSVYDDLEKLINVSKNVYDDTEIGGAVVINDYIYYVPVEYKDLVEKVYKRIKNQNTPLYQESSISNLGNQYSPIEYEYDILTDEEGSVYYWYSLDGTLSKYDVNGEYTAYANPSMLPRNMLYYDEYGETYCVDVNGEFKQIYGYDSNGNPLDSAKNPIDMGVAHEPVQSTTAIYAD